jgi:hypothetical protein
MNHYWAVQSFHTEQNVAANTMNTDQFEVAEGHSHWLIQTWVRGRGKDY